VETWDASSRGDPQEHGARHTLLVRWTRDTTLTSVWPARDAARDDQDVAGPLGLHASGNARGVATGTAVQWRVLFGAA